MGCLASRKLVVKSWPERSSCGFCRQVFATAQIVEWLDGGHTAVCPLCQVDCVDPGESTPQQLLDRHRTSFGHRPDERDPLPIRELQRLSDRLTVLGDEECAEDVLDAVRWRGRIEAELRALDSESNEVPRLFFALMAVDAELRHHRARFQELDGESRMAAWGSLELEDMPYWCRLE
jgi:hypothetical protein